MEQGPAGQPTGQQPPAGGSGGGLNEEMTRQLADFREGFSFGDFITFRFMITPPLITVIYVVAVIVITIGALAALNASVLGAILGWIVVMLWVRVVFEVMIVLFRINDGIQKIARR